MGSVRGVVLSDGVYEDLWASLTVICSTVRKESL
jgi:hypothetical protein